MQISESRSTVRDGRTGEERMKLTRGLGGRQRTLERSRRGRDAPEETREELHGINTGEDAQAFDREWQQAARASGTLQHGSGAARSQQERRRRPQGLPWSGHGQRDARSEV